MVPLVTVGEILPALGLKTPPPLLGWVFSEKWARTNPASAKGLIDASYEAKHAMLVDDALWTSLRPLMDADSDSLFEALKSGYRAGIPAHYSLDDVAAAEAAFRVMHDVNPASAEGLDGLPAGTFWPAYQP
jgi:NitT/TauT family transport system substrate-binding protein